MFRTQRIQFMQAAMIGSIILLTILTAGRARSAPLRAPALNVTPSSGLAGSAVTLNGTGYSGGTASIFWAGQFMESFPFQGDTFSRPFTIPAGQKAGSYVIKVCASLNNQCYTGEFAVEAETIFNIVDPTQPPPPPPNTPIPTDVPPQPTDIPPSPIPPSPIPPSPIPPTRIPPSPTARPASPTPQITATIPSISLPGGGSNFGLPFFVPTLIFAPDYGPLASTCGDLGLPDAPDDAVYVEDFEGSRLRASIFSFESTAEIYRPSVAAHSGTGVMASQLTSDLNQSFLPLRVSMRYHPARAIGMYFGLEDPDYTTEEIIVSMQVLGYTTGSTTTSLIATVSQRMPAAATPVDRCLSYIAEDGFWISEFVINYTDRFGRPIAERRLVDDLTAVLDYAAVESIPDNRPTVQVTRPADGASFTSGSMRIEGTAADDRGIISAYLTVNGTRQGDPLFLSMNTDSPPTYTVRADVVASSLIPYRTNTIGIKVYDLAGYSAIDEVAIYYNPPPTPTPIPALNIRLHQLEMIQVTQCIDNPACGADNSIPMYTGKPTLVRLYVSAENTGGSEPNVSAILCHHVTGVCIPSENRVFVSETDNPVRDYRGDLTRTLNFLVPADWLRVGRFAVRAYVNPGGADIAERTYADNWTTASVMVERGRHMNINLIRVRTMVGVLDPSVRRTAMSYVRSIYPLESINMRMPGGDSTIDSPYDYTDRSGSGCGSGWGGLQDDIYWYNVWTEDGVPALHYYGMVSSMEPVGYGGCGMYPPWGYISSGLAGYADPNATGTIMAQELGHNLGQRHAPGCGAGNPDASYPAGTDAGGTPMRGIIGEYGIDMRTRAIHLPDSSYDFMGYCGGTGNTWVSPYTYRYIATRIAAAAGLIDPDAVTYTRSTGYELDTMLQPDTRPVMQDSGEHLMATFLITEQDAELRNGYYRMPLPSDTQALETPQGPFRVQLLGADGSVLDEGFFQIAPDSENHLHEGEPGQFSTGHLIVAMPWTAGTATIVLSYEGTELHRTGVSASDPVVTLTSPNGGEAWDSGAVTITWQGSDPDGDALTYVVEYSPDGSQWQHLGHGLSETSLVVDASTLPGGDGAVIRVNASDGVNTARDVSDAPFSVTLRPPTVEILYPQDGTAYPVGSQIVFDALASDAEDPLIEPTQYRWVSSIDGEIGSGAVLWAVPLSAGDHNITLTVTDSDGLAAEAHVTVRVENDPTALPDLAFIAEWETEGSGVTLDEDVIEPKGASNLQRVLLVAGGLVTLIVLALAGVAGFLFLRRRTH